MHRRFAVVFKENKGAGLGCGFLTLFIYLLFMFPEDAPASN
jgi:hypothetical protein